jgi:polyphosphate kinase
MNGLLERGTVEALYAASQAGVQIDLIVRGMCSLRPGIPGLSENIRVRSIVGRFLEHSRIFSFANGGHSQIFCGSADWMTRNLFERCEVVFPVEDPALCKRLRDQILAAYLADTRKARLLQPNGEYLRVTPLGHKATDKAHETFSAQDYLMRIAEGTADGLHIPDTHHTPKVHA